MFGKKKPKELPIDEVRRMAAKGMSDKDIIKELKHKGFDYSEIEKVMLQVVKEGVDEPQPQFVQPEELAPPAPLREQPQPQFFEEAQEEVPELDLEQSNALLEELVEGVVEEKWHKFEDRLNKIDETFDRIKAEIKQFEEKVSEERSQGPARELEAKIGSISEQIEDLDARVGGLEKAFKQFLPALTRNIESLSQLIHEMKEKAPALEEEV